MGSTSPLKVAIEPPGSSPQTHFGRHTDKELALAGAWSVWLAHRQLGVRAAGARRARALFGFAIALTGVPAAWMPFVFRVM